VKWRWTRKGEEEQDKVKKYEERVRGEPG